MFNGKKKAITFSYDDGVTQDVRLAALLHKYGLKATFNINSGLLGQEGYIKFGDLGATHTKVCARDVRAIYEGHEIAAHTLVHKNLTTLPNEEVIREVEQDRLALCELAGYTVVGMAYPCGGENNNEHVASLIRQNTGICYARTITCTESFLPPDNLWRLNPTVFHLDFDKMAALAERFLRQEKAGLFYIWGHSYEFDIFNNWDAFEDFCRMVSGHADVFYGTNRQVLGV